MQLSPLSLTENNSLLYNKFSPLAVKIILPDFKASSHHMNIWDRSMPKKPFSRFSLWPQSVESGVSDPVSRFFGHRSQAGNIQLIHVVLLRSWEGYKR